MDAGFEPEEDGSDLIPNCARISNALARLTARAERAEAALPPAAKLRGIAEFFDRFDADRGQTNRTEVQDDLRKWADAIDAAMKEGGK